MSDSNSVQNFNRRKSDEDVAALARLEESMRWVVKSVETLHENDKQIHQKIDANNAVMQSLISELQKDANQAKGAAKAVEWIGKNWPALGASLIAAAAFFKSGGPPAA